MTSESAEFSFDTSGVVVTDNGKHTWTETAWPDLSPFVQGYVRAAKQARRLIVHRVGDELETLDWAFRHLAPATLAAMMKDCERFQANPARRWINGVVAGSEWFRCRQRGDYAHIGFPPQTLSLGDDGLIYAEAGQ
jgi:hypothetical protein